MELVGAAGTTQRAISYYENDAGVPPASAVIALARALQVTADELLGIQPPKLARPAGGAQTRRLWKKFQLIGRLPEKDRRAVVRLINSLVAASGQPRLRAAG